mgnify:CR=1 FL=1
MCIIISGSGYQLFNSLSKKTGKGVKKLVNTVVRDNNVEQALRAQKKKLQREGVYREMKQRRHYEKPSEKRQRKKTEGIKRQRKLKSKNEDK